MGMLILACALTLVLPVIGALQGNTVAAGRQTVIVDGIGYGMVQVRHTVTSRVEYAARDVFTGAFEGLARVMP